MGPRAGFSYGLLTFVSLAAASAQVQQVAEDLDHRIRFVCLDTDRRAFGAETLAAADPLQTWTTLSERAGERQLSHCWAWSGACTPRRLLPGEDPAAACSSHREEAARLRVNVAPSRSAEAGASSGIQPVEIVAAPVDLWTEAPVSLLPILRGERRSLSIMRSSEPWRIQVRAEGRASALRDVSAGQASVDVTLLPAPNVSVQVIAGGHALQDARLSFVRRNRSAAADAGEITGFEVTDNEGTIQFTMPKADRSAAIVSSPARAAAAFPRLGELPEIVELASGFAVSGQVVTADGEPIPAVRLLGRSWIPSGFGLQQRHAGVSGADGWFRLVGFPAGPAALTADGGDLGFARALELQGSVDLGRIALTRPEQAWVRTVNEVTGEPVENAGVRNQGGEWTTTGDGGLALVPLDFGRRVFVSAPGYVQAELDLPERAGVTADEALAIGLEPAFWVRGVFVAADGHTPAVGGRLSASNSAANTSSFRAVGADGSFALDLSPGDYTLELWAANAARRRLEISGRAGEIRDLGTVAAPVSAWVSGHVVAPDYVAVPGATVSYTRPSEAGPLAAWALGQAVSTVADANGYFEIYGLELGESVLRVEAEGFPPREFEVEAANVEWIDAGYVVLAHGRRVTVRSDVGSGTVEVEPGEARHPRDRISSRLIDGEAGIEGVAEGPLFVRVLEGGVAVCEKASEASGDTVVACNRSSIRVTGGVTIAGQPAEGMLLWRQNRGGSDSLPGVIMSTGSGPMQRSRVVTEQAQELQVMLAAEGLYRLEAVLPGEWDVIWAPLSGGVREARRVNVPDGPGRQATIDFRYEGVAVDGIVFDPEGLAVAYATVDVFPQRSWVMSDQDGRFSVLDLQPGAYQLQARERHLRSRLVDISLRDYGDHEAVELHLEAEPPSNELTIRAVSASSGFCFVETPSSYRKVAQVRAGVATVELFPPLPERLRVACRADGRWILDDWRDLRRALQRGVEFDLDDSNASISLVGKTTGPAVRITGPGGWDIGSLRLWFGGASTFSVGETITNLPVGSYTLTWADQARTVWAERRRTTEIEIEM